MVCETISILKRSRGSIQSHRDAIKAETGVSISFPLRPDKNGQPRVYGDYQDMVLTGTTDAIKSVKKTLRTIIAEADKEFWAYKERRSKRNQKQRRVVPPPTTSTLPKVQPRKSNNIFDVLADNDEHIDDTVEEFPALTSTNNAHKTVSWGAHLNHQNEEETSTSNPGSNLWSEW